MVSFNILFGVVLAACILGVNCSPVPTDVAVAEAATEDSRDGRFYGGGLAAAQATAIASGSGGYGFPGYGGGTAIATANAVASGGGFPYGK